MSILTIAAERAERYLSGLDTRPVFPTAEALAGLSAFSEPVPEKPGDPEQVLQMLDECGSPGTIAISGRRYFGFVIGGSLPAALAANWMASAWDQNPGLVVGGPVACTLEEVSLGWLVDLLGLPQGTQAGFVTGATVANFTALAAARHSVLARLGWDVEAQGLFGAPPITVIAGEEVHVSVLKAISMLGLGRDRVIRVPADDQGRMRADLLPAIEGPTIVCIQAGNVNTGAFDPAPQICSAAHPAGAWVHVDAAFGLWAAAAPARAYLMEGFSDADSWATDAHKWLNVPYDSGIAFVRDGMSLRAAMSSSPAAYLVESNNREPSHYTPELSRRARGVDIWAALKSLGRQGVAEMIERSCRHASRFAEGLRAAGYHVPNDVVLNQVLVSFGEDEQTRRVIAGIQADGTCWCGGTVWQGRAYMRISVSSWATTGEDVEMSLAAMLRVAASA